MRRRWRSETNWGVKQNYRISSANASIRITDCSQFTGASWENGCKGSIRIRSNKTIQCIVTAPGHLDSNMTSVKNSGFYTPILVSHSKK